MKHKTLNFKLSAMLLFFALPLLIISTKCLAQRNNLIIYMGFEDELDVCGDGSCTWNYQGGSDCNPINQSWVKEGEFCAPAPRSGKYMFRTKTWKNIPKECYPGHSGNPKVRTEILGPQVLPVNSERWIGFSVYFPTANGPKPDKPVAFAQWHYNSGGFELLKIEIKNNNYHFTHWNDALGKRQNPGFGTVEYDKWIDIVIHIKVTQPSNPARGFVKIYIDDKEELSILDIDMQRDTSTKTARAKLGQYAHQGWPESNPDEIVVFHDEYRIGDENASYQHVAPGKR